MTNAIQTGAAARELGLSEVRLQTLIRAGRVPAPESIAGRRLWTPRDVERAREALAARTADVSTAKARA